MEEYEEVYDVCMQTVFSGSQPVVIINDNGELQIFTYKPTNAAAAASMINSDPWERAHLACVLAHTAHE